MLIAEQEQVKKNSFVLYAPDFMLQFFCKIKELEVNKWINFIQQQQSIM